MGEVIEKQHKTQLMGHIVAGYPHFELSLNAALGIAKAGASYLEVQFPFSDPNADGIVIEEACNKSIEEGFSVAKGFELLSALSTRFREDSLPTKLIIMTYGNIIFRYGVESFVKKAKECGVWGLIVPDLPIESDESLRVLAKKHKLAIISLITPNTPPKRMTKLAKISDEIVYVVARAGITGDKTHLNTALFEYIECVKKHCQKPIALGFGINSYEQVALLEGKVDIVVAGSYFVRYISTLATQANLTPQDYAQKLQAYTQALMGWEQENQADS